METKIDHLKVEEYAKRAQVSKLKRSAEALRSENQELYSQKNRVLGDIAAFRNVHSVLMKGILYVPCKHCGWPYIKLKMPSKQEYLHMIRNCEGYMVLCQNCHKISFFHSQEIVAGIGWALLPEDVVISTNA